MSELDAVIAGVDALISKNPAIVAAVNIKASNTPQWLQECVHQSAVMGDTLYTRVAIAQMAEHIEQQRIEIVRVELSDMPSSNKDAKHNQNLLNNLPYGLTGEYTGNEWGYADGYINLTDLFWAEAITAQNRFNCNVAELEMGDQSWHKTLLWCVTGIMNPLARIPYGHKSLYVFFKNIKWLSWARSNNPFKG